MAGAVIAGNQTDYGQGTMTGTCADDRDKVQYRKNKGQQQAVGLVDEEEPGRENEEYAQGQNKLRFEIAAEGLHENALEIAAKFPHGFRQAVGGQKAQPGIIRGDEVAGHHKDHRGNGEGGNAGDNAHTAAQRGVQGGGQNRLQPVQQLGGQPLQIRGHAVGKKLHQPGEILGQGFQ